jgi:hypothetical protein
LYPTDAIFNTSSKKYGLRLIINKQLQIPHSSPHSSLYSSGFASNHNKTAITAPTIPSMIRATAPPCPKPPLCTTDETSASASDLIELSILPPPIVVVGGFPVIVLGFAAAVAVPVFAVAELVAAEPLWNTAPEVILTPI